MIIFIYSIILIFLAVSTSFLIFYEIKQKSVFIKLCLLLVIIVLFIIITLLSNYNTAINTAISTSITAHFNSLKIQSEIIESNNNLLNSIFRYLDSGKDTQLLIDKIPLLIKESIESSTRSFEGIQYDWQKQIKNYKKFEDQIK